MVRIGTVYKVIGQKRLLVELNRIVKFNEKVYDSNGNLIGIVKDIIGRVDSPFAVIQLAQEGVQPSPNAFVFIKTKEEKGSK